MKPLRFVTFVDSHFVCISQGSECGFQVYVYGQGQRQLCAIFAGNGPDDGLHSFTSSSVSVRRGRNIYTYDAQGRQISSVYAG